MKRKKTFSALAGLVLVIALLLIAQWKLELHWGAPAGARSKVLLNQVLPNSKANRARVAAVAPETRARIRLEIQSEALRISRPTEDPDTIEDSLQARGEALQPVDIEALQEMLLIGNPSGDETGLALDLLGRSDEKAANEVLLDYVLKGPQSPTTEQSTFKLLALDGLIDQASRNREPEALRRIQKESSDSLLAKRAAQAEGALSGKNPWPRETDEKALRQLLEKGSTH